jgi:hypothetical protein
MTRIRITDGGGDTNDPRVQHKGNVPSAQVKYHARTDT